MSAASEIAAECGRHGVTLTIRDGRLRYTPASAVPVELLARMRYAKADLLDLLVVPASSQPLRSTDPNADEDAHGRPNFGCHWCGCREFAHDLVERAYVCTACHPPGELRAHVARWTLPHPRRGERAE